MNGFTRIALLLRLALATSAVSRAARAATIDEQNSARLDALERENAALRARVNRLEAPRAAKLQPCGHGRRSGTRFRTTTAKPRYLGRLPCQSHRRPDIDRATLRGQRVAVVPATRRRQS